VTEFSLPFFGALTWIDIFLLFWFVLTALSVIYVAYDAFVNNPELTVMKWGWVLVTIYTGPIGAAIYVLSCKEPRPFTHEEFIKPLWKQGVGSTIHCVAGDATGIVVAATVTAAIGFPMWVDIIVEYAAGFAFGLFIFQALFMKDMMGGSYRSALGMSFMPEWLSMNMMMAGMIPVMVAGMMGRDMRAMEPEELLYWGVMSLGIMAGAAIAYPVNVWLVSKGLKHGMGTQRALGSGGHSMEAEKQRMEGLKLEASRQHEGHGTGDDQHTRSTKKSGSASGEHSLSGMEHGKAVADSPAFTVTGPQQFAVAGLTVLALAVGFLWSARNYNLTLSAKDVGGLVMPPGMIMTWETSAETMRDMAAVNPDDVEFTADGEARGDLLAEARIEDGVKVYDLETSVIRWNILPDIQVMAYAFNEQVPGPRIRVTEGDRLRFNVTNNLPESTSVHWHGLILPNGMDGPADITQDPIEPGETFTYEFTARQRGTFFYHSHDHADRQQALGLYGALIIDPAEPPDETYDHELVVQLQEWLHRDDYTFPAMPMEGGMPNFFTINGKAYPSTETVPMRVGETLLVRFIGSSNGFIHPMHIHGGPFSIIETDGYPVPEAAQLVKDTVNVGPGERYDVVWEAREPGKWLLHCHINHHATNDNREEEGGGGLMLILEVSP